MATTGITMIEGNVWTSDLDLVKVETDRSQLAFTIATGSPMIWSMTTVLNQDADGYVYVRDLRSLIEPVVASSLGVPVSFEYRFNVPSGSAELNGRFTAYMSRTGIGADVASFISGRFLTLMQNRPKLTALGRKEYLHLYVSESTPVTVSETYWHDGTMVNFTITFTTLASSTSVHTVDVSPDLFVRSGYQLTQYIVRAGARTAVFRIDDLAIDAAPCIVFRNSFGCQETIYCRGTHVDEMKMDRSTAWTDGELVLYDTHENREYQAATGILSPAMAEWADDLLRSTETYLLDASGTTARRITITDHERKYTNDYEELRGFTFKYRPSSRLQTVTLVEGHSNIFDDTFDYTFN